MIIYIICITFLVLIDQITKMIVALNVKNEITLVKNILYVTYERNTGAAFSILKDKTYIFIIITIIACVGMLYYLVILAKHKNQKLETMAIILILAGALGNLIDRIRFRYVVDFIYFKPINWPVFNLADSFIVIGCFLYIIFVIRSSSKNRQGGKF